MSETFSKPHAGFEPIDLRKDTPNLGFSGVEVQLPDGSYLRIKCRVIPNIDSDLSKVLRDLDFELRVTEHLFNSETRVLRILTRTTHIGNQPPDCIEKINEASDAEKCSS